MAVNFGVSNTNLATMGSEFVSPFMNPVLYFTVSEATAITNPTAEIEIAGASETITIEACYEKTASSLHYFYVDLSEVMKYVLRRFDGIEYPDNLEFLEGTALRAFDEYIRRIEIDVYFERGTANQQTNTETNYWCYLADKYPYTRGFNLYNLIYPDPLYLKWGKDTYNAVFFIGRPLPYSIKLNGTEIRSGTGTYKYYQLKFIKTEVRLQQGLNTLTVDIGTGAFLHTNTFYIDYDPTCTSKHSLCWQHPQFGYVSYPFEGAMVTETNVSRGIEVEKVFTTMVNASQMKEQLGYKKTKTITLRAKVEKKYWPLFEDLYNSRHVYLFTGATGAADSLATWMECRVTGGYSDNDTRNAKVFSVELQAAEQFPISF